MIVETRMEACRDIRQHSASPKRILHLEIPSLLWKLANDSCNKDGSNVEMEAGK
jgi:hypothetical protein